MLPGAPVVGDLLAPHSDPDQLADQAGVRLGERDERIARAYIAAEDVDAAAGHLRLHQAAIEKPEQVRGEPRAQRIVTRRAHAADDVAGILFQPAEEFNRELWRLLQVGGHHGKKRPGCLEQAGADRGKGAEVARHLEHLRGETRTRQCVDEQGKGPVGAAVDDEHDLERAVERAVDVRQRSEQIGDRLLVAVDRNYERVTGCHRLQAATTSSISVSVSSG